MWTELKWLIKVDIREIIYKNVNWIQMIQNGSKFGALIRYKTFRSMENWQFPAKLSYCKRLKSNYNAQS